MSDAAIRCDGLYVFNTAYLRFYPDGVVVYMPSDQPLPGVAQRLVRDRDPDRVDQGTYRVVDGMLDAFLESKPPPRSYGYSTLSIDGRIEGEQLHLRLSRDEPGVADYGVASSPSWGEAVFTFVALKLP